jgi:hypothetical protein
VTGPDGSFTLSTYGDGDGAPQGGYQVVLLWPPEQVVALSATGVDGPPVLEVDDADDSHRDILVVVSAC